MRPFTWGGPIVLTVQGVALAALHPEHPGYTFVAGFSLGAAVVMVLANLLLKPPVAGR